MLGCYLFLVKIFMIMKVVVNQDSMVRGLVNQEFVDIGVGKVIKRGCRILWKPVSML